MKSRDGSVGVFAYGCKKEMGASVESEDSVEGVGVDLCHFVLIWTDAGERGLRKEDVWCLERMARASVRLSYIWRA